MSIEQLIESFGYLALFVGTFLEGETVLVLAGFAAQRGHLALPWVMVVAFAGSLLGDQLFFLLGRWKGKAFLDRRVSWRPRVEQANRLLERHHTWILLGFRFLYGLRSVIPFVIGTTRIRTGRFIVLNVIGGIVWAVVVGWLGYLFGQAMAKVLMTYDLLAGLNLNYSSLSAVTTTLIIMGTVLASVIYPAKRASEIAVPGIERRWRLPDPENDQLVMTLPFTVTGDQALGVNVFLREYLEAHADYSLGHFSTGDIRMRTVDTPRGQAYELDLMVWLAPYDLGVSERLLLRTVPSEDEEEVFDIRCAIARESGDESSWIRVTRNFVNMLRKQYLLWRTFRPELKAEYGHRGRELIPFGDSR